MLKHRGGRVRARSFFGGLQFGHHRRNLAGGDVPLFGSGAGGEVGVFTWWADGSEKVGLDALVKLFGEKFPNDTFVNLAVAGGAGTNANASWPPTRPTATRPTRSRVTRTLSCRTTFAPIRSCPSTTSATAWVARRRSRRACSTCSPSRAPSTRCRPTFTARTCCGRMGGCRVHRQQQEGRHRFVEVAEGLDRLDQWTGRLDDLRTGAGPSAQSSLLSRPRRTISGSGSYTTVWSLPS